jgi:SpoIID/LytB domain protein
VDDGLGRFRWTVTRSADQLAQILLEKHLVPRDLYNDTGCRRVDDLQVTRRGPGGRATQVQIDYVDRNDAMRRVTVDGEYWIRHALHESFLYSSAFDVRIERDAKGRTERFGFAGAGWGHGAGMCQIGALGMALRGFDHERILHHYFEGVRIEERG